MKTETVTNKHERRVLTGMIVNNIVCGRIAAKWESHLFRSRWANLIGDLCVEFYRNHGKAPRKSIESLFETWSQTANDKETVAVADKFLAGLSDEYAQLRKEINPSYLVDLAGKHFTETRLRKLAEEIQANLELGRVTKASRRVELFGSVDLGAGQSIKVLKDEATLEAAFKEVQQPLFTFPGALGKFFGPSLVRGGFVAFLAPEKRGKTWWLCECAWQAINQRKRVAFFSVGDETMEEMMLRFAIRASRHPLRAGIVTYPSGLRIVKGKARVRLRQRKFSQGLSFQRAVKAFRRQRIRMKSKEADYLRMIVTPNSMTDIRGIEEQLTVWQKEDNWIPDIIIIDYMDILKESGFGQDDARHRINATWKDTRALSQKTHTLILTATQANAASYKEKLMSKTNFAEDKRKMAHVTGMIGLNQTDAEKKLGIFRLNWIVRRGAAYESKRYVTVASALGIGNPAVRSR